MDAELQRRLALGSEEEREEILSNLEERCAERLDERHDDEPYSASNIALRKAMTDLALAYIHARRFSQAAVMFEQLVRMTAAFAESGVHRRSLASTYEDLEWFQCSRYHLTKVVAECPAEELRLGCQNQLEHLDAVIADRDAEVDLRRLQLERALERAEHGDTDVAALERVARTIVAFLEVTPDHTCTRRARTLLCRGTEDHPNSAELLRGLLHCCLILGDESPDRLLQRLEELEPESTEMTHISAHLATGRRGFPVPEVARHAWSLLRLLSPDDPSAQLADPGIEAAALGDMRSFAEHYPYDMNCAMAYAFGLVTAGQLTELGTYLPQIATLEQPSHTFHFNYGQLLVASGDRLLGSQHLARSLELATTDKDREDAVKALRQLEL